MNGTLGQRRGSFAGIITFAQRVIVFLTAVLVTPSLHAAECCSSLIPRANPATAYGFGLLRPEHRKPLPEIGLTPFQDISGSLETVQFSVLQAEREHGPYAETLVPKLIDLSSVLLANAKVADSVKALFRALHLTRINNGFDTPLQIPILEGLIEMHLATGQWQLADQRLAVLYRIQQMQYGSYDPNMLSHLQRYADWHRTMYLAGVDQVSYARLLSIHELYTGMIESIEAELGRDSVEHIPYLYGQLETEYLVSLYEGERETGFRISIRQEQEVDLPTWEQQRLKQIKENNYRSGKKAIARILAILEKDPEAMPSDIAEAKVALGDWHIWFFQPALAKRSYQEAHAIMAQEENGNTWLAETFGDPRELPASAVFQPGVIAPETSYNNIDVRLRFDVSRLGKARRIQILSPSKEEKKNATIRAYKMLRDTRFRPAMRGGELVAAKDIKRSYKIAY